LETLNDIYLGFISKCIFFTLKNSVKFPAICVTGAGLLQLNGIYNLFVVRDGVGLHSNGLCILGRQEGTKLWHFFMLDIQIERVKIGNTSNSIR
jgi:hypothetical protein